MSARRSLLLLTSAGAMMACGLGPIGPDGGTSTLEIRVASTGLGIEPDSVTILLDGQPIGVASGHDLLGLGWVKRMYLAEGSHEVRVEDVAPNCGADRIATAEVHSYGAAANLTLVCRLPLGDLVLLRQTAADWGDLTYLPPGGGPPERLGLSRVQSAAWSPDGTRLAVIAPTHGRQALLLVDPQGGAATELGTEIGLWPGDLSWSPDGTTLGYTQFFQNGQSAAMLVNVDGSNPRPLLAGDPGTSTASPVWSPDGTAIAFLLDGDVHVIEVATGNVTRLSTGGSASAPAWAPDGSRLTYAAGTQVWVAGRSGDGRRLVSEDTYGYYEEPQWLPDGSGLLVERWEYYDFIGDEYGEGSLVEVNLETGRRVQVSGEKNLYGVRFRPAGS
jgi:WD40 repeat protein